MGQWYARQADFAPRPELFGGRRCRSERAVCVVGGTSDTKQRRVACTAAAAAAAADTRDRRELSAAAAAVTVTTPLQAVPSRRRRRYGLHAPFCYPPDSGPPTLAAAAAAAAGLSLRCSGLLDRIAAGTAVLALQSPPRRGRLLFLVLSI